jgi:hypothetical protein
MEVTKLDPLKSLTENVLAITHGENIEYTFEVVPLDVNVIDKTSPTLFLTDSFLVLYYDETLEAYELGEIKIDLVGESPKFTLWQQLTEGNYYYSNENPENLTRMRSFDGLTRLSITSPRQVPKDFVLRQGTFVKKSVNTWAMYRIIKNIQKRIESEKALEDMLVGNFVNFNTRTVLTFIVVFLAYLMLKLLTMNYAEGLPNTILDFIFGGVVIAMAVWTVLSINKNLQSYQAVYHGYHNWQDEDGSLPRRSDQNPDPYYSNQSDSFHSDSTVDEAENEGEHPSSNRPPTIEKR